jgi:Activator of Hsp90 ATPase homolog 1-like protein
VTFDLEPRGKVVKLTVTHDNLDEGGKTLRDISGGWPMVLASLKSLLETGRVPVIDPPAVAVKEDAHA